MTLIDKDDHNSTTNASVCWSRKNLIDKGAHNLINEQEDVYQYKTGLDTT